jgi:hypothetical protein
VLRKDKRTQEGSNLSSEEHRIEVEGLEKVAKGQGVSEESTNERKSEKEKIQLRGKHPRKNGRK